MERLDFAGTANVKQVLLGDGDITLSQFAAVARHGAKVVFSHRYCERVACSRRLLEGFIAEGRVIYGVTTGFGYNSREVIPPEEAARLQENILLSHACAVGQPLEREAVRGILLMMLLNLGQGYSGVRLETLMFIRGLLNQDIIPYAPSHGSVGYLSVEAHIALLAIGKGKAYVRGRLADGAAALAEAGLRCPGLEHKEGLALISGTTSVTALAALGLYDTMKAALSLDIAGAMTVEALRGTRRAFDARLHQIRGQEAQMAVAENVRKMLEGSEIAEQYADFRLQDALSLRSMPQLHGAAKKTLKDAYTAIIGELNACCDNPALYPEEDGSGVVLMGGNADGAYAGIEADSICIAAANLGKISERRTARLLDHRDSGLPPFLTNDAGVNSGFMVVQYTAAGILGEMRIFAHPATIDNVPTCANQEDYVSMGYNASRKALQIAGLLETVAAIELLAAAQALEFLRPLHPAPAAAEVWRAIRTTAPPLSGDALLQPCIEGVKGLVHSGTVIQCAERHTGALAF